ncbi:MAG: dTMP kinase [Prevotellaceae bacterium]|nr:dTMP kinase [Prevotellaceae bacterium]
MNFLAIEGLDGAGKSTQVSLLEKHLMGQGIRTKYMHFPRVDTGVFGDLIARFLRGDLGKINEVNPYLVALIFAEDRRVAAEQIKTWLREGYFVVVDRYVYSNIAFQCAKIQGNEAERRALRNWILKLEYEVFKIPQPQLSLFLDVPFEFITARLTEHRSGTSREYLEGKQDIHEASLDFQQLVRKGYLEQQPLDSTFRVVACANENGCMMQPASTFEKIKLLLETL